MNFMEKNDVGSVGAAAKCGALALALLLAVSVRGAAAPSVQPEVWTTDFPAAQARAVAEHRPLILTVGLTHCGGCQRMEQSMEDKVFRNWVRGTGIYLVRVHSNIGKDHPGDAAGTAFLMESPFLAKHGPPFAGIYWPKASNEEVRVAFSYHRTRMPGENSPSTIGEFINSADMLLADYFKGFPKRPTLDEIVAASKKHISVACEGGGTAKTEPENGELICGSSVKLVATPNPGFKLAQWRGPNGKVLAGKQSRTLTVLYRFQEGTYTAVFQKK